jgi:hypothetical protein
LSQRRGSESVSALYLEQIVKEAVRRETQQELTQLRQTIDFLYWRVDNLERNQQRWRYIEQFFFKQLFPHSGSQPSIQAGRSGEEL